MASEPDPKAELGIARSVRLDAGKFDDFAPLFSFIDKQLAEFRRRAEQRGSAEFGEPRLRCWVDEACV